MLPVLGALVLQAAYGADTSGSFAICLYHEHPAKCQFDEDRTGGTGINDRRYHIKCALLSASEPEKEGHLSKVEDIRSDLCYNSGHKCGRIQTYNAGG